MDLEKALCVFKSNPDIDGVGIRIAIYIQNALIALIIRLAEDDTVDSLWSAVVTSLSLQIAALAVRSQLGLHQLILVTLLGLPAFLIPFSYGFPIRLHILPYVEGETPGEQIPVKSGPVLLAIFAHTWIYLSFAMWVWAHEIPASPCAEAVHFFGMPVHGWLRYCVLIILAFLVFLAFWHPFFGPAGFAFVTHVLFEPSPSAWDFGLRRAVSRAARDFFLCFAYLEYTTFVPQKWGGLVNVASLVISITGSELLVREAQRAGAQSEDGASWGYGQITAMVLLLSPLFTLLNVVTEQHKGMLTRLLLGGHAYGPVQLVLSLPSCWSCCGDSISKRARTRNTDPERAEPPRRQPAHLSEDDSLPDGVRQVVSTQPAKRPPPLERRDHHSIGYPDTTTGSASNVWGSGDTIPVIQSTTVPKGRQDVNADGETRVPASPAERGRRRSV